jgi:hypothetical protein
MRAAPALLLAKLDLRAADFWEKTPDYRDWALRDVQDMLYKSPWVARVDLTPPGGGAGPGGGPGGGRGGGGFGGGGGGGFGAGGGGGGRGGGMGGGMPQRPPLYVRWQSARPVKEAISRARMGSEGGGSLTAEQQQWLDNVGEHCVIAISGLPPRMGMLAENAAHLAETAFLERKGKEPIQASSAEGMANERNVELYFLFPRTDPIVEDDKQVEFTATLHGPAGDGEDRQRRRGLPVKARFKLKDLVYKGELAL